MKKIIKGLIALGCAVGLLIPSVVSASYMCHPRCCELYNLQKWYRVSYFDEGHNWVTQNVSAWNSEGAAESLNLTAGKDCFVGFDRVNHDPVLYWYKVSHFDADHNWVTPKVQAENKKDAAAQFGLRVSYDCWVTKVF